MLSVTMTTGKKLQSQHSYHIINFTQFLLVFKILFVNVTHIFYKQHSYLPFDQCKVIVFKAKAA